MEQFHCTQAFTPVQRPSQPPPKSGIGFLAAVLDSLDDQPVIDALQRQNQTGRPGYPLRTMWRLYLVKFLLNIRYNNALLEYLHGNQEVRELCGLGDHIPSESALSRFVSRLANHTDIVEDCLLKVTDQLRNLVPTLKHHKDKQDQQPTPLPPLGAVVAIDSTLFETYANPNRNPVSDPDARWGVKHSSRTKEGKTEWAFGYKMHMLSDATHGIPLGFTITPANENDSTQLPKVLKEVQNRLPWLKPGALLADRGYDSLANHKFVYGLGIIPVIHMRKPTAADGLHDGLYAELGHPVCMGMEPMEYVRTNPNSGTHLFRCKVGGCPLKGQGTKAITHCDSETWESPDTNLRVLGPLPRFSTAWKRLYAQRMSIERIFRSFKHSRGLQGHCARGLRKITLQGTMSVLTYQATALTRLKAKDSDRLRRMSIKMH